MNRTEWIEAAYHELKRLPHIYGNLFKSELGYRSYANSLAEAYYDPEPNDYTPHEAVVEDASNV